MTKGRITDIVGKTAGRNDRRQLIFIKLLKVLSDPGIFIADRIPYGLPERPAHGGHLQTMRQAVMDENRPRKRKDLGFVLQTAKRRGKNDAVIIPEKRGPNNPIRPNRPRHPLYGRGGRSRS